MNLEPIAKGALDVAAGIVGSINPLAGILVAWAGKTAFAIIDQQAAGHDPVAAAQLAGDRVADLLEDLKVGPKP